MPELEASSEYITHLQYPNVMAAHVLKEIEAARVPFPIVTMNTAADRRSTSVNTESAADLDGLVSSFANSARSAFERLAHEINLVMIATGQHAALTDSSGSHDERSVSFERMADTLAQSDLSAAIEKP